MDYKSKYLKYKTKYINLQNLYGGANKNKTTSEIIYGYEKISNKGTQNCGVYINYKDPKKILLCNNSNLSREQNDFLHNDNNDLKIYPKLYESYESKDTKEYFYLWEKMDGDLRDFFLKHIPTRILKKYKPGVTEEQIKIFIDFINCKTYQTKLYVIDTPYDDTKYTLLGSLYETKLLYKNVDETNIKYKLNIIKLYDNMLSDININIIYDILTEIEHQLNDIIKSLTYKRYLMYQHNFYTDDEKFDNIVYKIIENNDDDYKYEFYFIDPESTLKKDYYTSEEIFKNIVNDIKSKYDTFKMSDAFPNIYNTFLTNMFDIADYEDNHENTYTQLYLDYARKELKEGDKRITGQGWHIAIKKFNIDINNVLPLKINTEYELLQFVK
jgi:hypothetical protein